MKDDAYFMRQALIEAQRAFDEDEVPVGAVLVINQQIISRAHNQTELLQDPTAHAEILAITAACNALGSKYLPQASLFVTLEPCLMCSGALYWTQVGQIIYGARDEKRGYSAYFSEAVGAQHSTPFHPKAKISQGLLEEECKALLQDFFKKKR